MRITLQSYVSKLSKSLTLSTVLIYLLLHCYMSLEKRRTLRKAVIESQFTYCPLIWVLHFRILNNKINCIHKRASRALNSDYKSFFNEHHEKGGFFTTHQKICPVFSNWNYKHLRGLSPTTLGEVLKVNEGIPYESRMGNKLHAVDPKTVRYGTETIIFCPQKFGLWYQKI